MTSGQKVAVSLLVSVVLFAVFTVAAFAGLFNFIEVKFYQPKVTGEIEERLEKISDAQNRYVDSLFKRFDSFISDEAVRTYLESRPDDNAVQKRERSRVNLMMDTRALKGIRIIDPAGINILYSSFSSDIMSSTSSKITYRKYSDLTSAKVSPEILYSDIKVSDTKINAFGKAQQNRVFFDEEQNRVVFSMPFYDSSENYSGTIAFYCDPSDLSRFLFEENLIDITGFGFLISNSDGFGGYVFGLSNVGRTSMKELILEQWEIDSRSNSESQTSPFMVRNVVPVLNADSALENESVEKNNDVKILFSRRSVRDDLGFIAWIYDKDIMHFPQTVKLLLLILVFVTLYLIVYLLFNFRHDDMVVIKRRIKQFQLSFVTESLENFDKEKERFLNFEEKKENINKEIKNSLGSRGRKYSKEIDSLLESSWSDLFRAMGLKSDGKTSASVDSAELKRVLEEVLGSGNVKINAVALQTPSSSNVEKTLEISDSTSKTITSPSEVKAEEVEEAEEAETAETAETKETAEEIEEIEEISDAEEVEEAEEAETAENIEEIEEISDAEEVEDAETTETAETEETAEEIEEIFDAEEVEEAEEAETAENIEEIEEIEEISDAEEVEDAETTETAETEETAEEIEEISDAEEVEEAETAETAEETEETAEEIEEISDAEEVEDAETTETAETAEEIEEIEEVPKVSDILAETESDVSDEVPKVSDILGEDEICEMESAETKEDYISLKAVQESEQDNGEKLEELEDVDVEYFGVKAKSYNFSSDPDFREPLTFGWTSSSTKKTEVAAESVDDFVIGKLDFSVLDKPADAPFEKNPKVDLPKTNSESEKTEETEENQEIEEIQEIEETADEVQTLGNKAGVRNFSLTGFSAFGNVSDLISE